MPTKADETVLIMLPQKRVYEHWEKDYRSVDEVCPLKDDHLLLEADVARDNQYAED